MRKPVMWVLVCLAPSCGGTSTILFTGQNVSDGAGTFAVVGKKEEHRIDVADLALGIGLRLPYAEDWEFEPTPQKPISGRSGSLLTFVTVQSFNPGRPVEEEAFLRDEYLKNLRSGNERRGIPFFDVVLEKQGSHFVLEYTNEGTFPNGVKFRQFHFWTFRQRPDGLIYEAHLSTNNPREQERSELCKKLRAILGGEFKVLPAGEKQGSP
jgi:hypothetical protein